MTQLPYATVKNPTIEAIVNGLFRFDDPAKAVERLHTLKQYFTIAKDQPEEPLQIRIWINGYDITEEEEKLGHMGNFAIVQCYEPEENKFGLIAHKEEVELKFHPQRRRRISKHPNWGHPVLRLVKKGQTYDSIEEARAKLAQLHEEYPNISIPCTSKMYIIIYSRDKKPPVQKYVLEIKANEENKFYIEATENKYKRTKSPTQATKENTEAVGSFTAKVLLKRK